MKTVTYGRRGFVSLGIAALLTGGAFLSTGFSKASAAASCTGNPSCDVFAGGGGPATATWTGGPVVGTSPDVNGPPEPVCQPGNCDRTAFTVHAAAGFTANNEITVSATATFDPGTTGGQVDVGILDASSSHAISSVTAANSPATAVAHDLPPGTYVVEVDGDTGDPVSMQTYSGSLSVSTSVRPPAPTPNLSSAITFSTPTVVDPVHSYGEPDIRIDHHGRVYVSGPTGTGTQRSLWSTSVDGGATWRQVSQGPPPTSVSPNPLTQPGGGDTDIAFDRSDKQYFADLYALACQRVAVTTNAGATTTENPGGCAPGLGGSDRQWLLVNDPPPGITVSSAYKGPYPLVYMEYNDVETPPATGSTGPAFWAKSVPGANPDDPGLTYSSARGTPQKTVFGADGYPSIDQVTGKVFQPNFSGQSVKLNIGTPDASGNLSFLDDASGGTANLITVANNVDNNGDVANFVVSSMDEARNLWVAWVGRDNGDPSKRQVFVAVASAATNWTIWSQPVQVSSPPSLVNIFPWVKASGRNGVADVVWYGSNVPSRPGFYPDPSTDLGQEWNVYMAQVTYPVDAGGGVQVLNGPAFAPLQVQVTPHPMDYNSACLQGTGCITSEGNRNLADFFEINSDANGAAQIVYDDLSNGLCQEAPGFTPTGAQVADHCGAAVVTVARQDSGPGLLGTDVSTTNTYPSKVPRGNGIKFADNPGARPDGDALFPVIAGGPAPSSNVPGMDLLGTSLSLSGGVLTVTSDVLDLSNPAATEAAVASSNLQFVTRWVMATPGDTHTPETHHYSMFYAMAEYGAQGAGCPTGNATTPCFYAGTAQSVDLCSVSACDPHVTVYPESGGTEANQLSGVNEPGQVQCPASPSVLTPCTVTININATDVGAPTATSLLEEVGTYSLASARPQAPLTNAQAQADQVPLEIDGVCCFNFQASTPSSNVPETPWTPALVGAGIGLLAASLAIRRRRRRASLATSL